MDYRSANPWGYLITEDKRATPLLKSLYRAIVNYIVSSTYGDGTLLRLQAGKPGLATEFSQGAIDSGGSTSLIRTRARCLARAWWCFVYVRSIMSSLLKCATLHLRKWPDSTKP